jgi:DnaJ-class molecular chaperone
VTANQSRRPRTDPDRADYYEILGVPYTATFHEITRAYRDAMKRAHPDRQRPDRRAAAEERAKLLNTAFRTLSKAESRRAYDATIKATAVQDQIMNRYFGGFAVPGEHADPFGNNLRRKQSSAERADQRRADRSAIVSIFFVFAAITLVALGLLIVFALFDALAGRLF